MLLVLNETMDFREAWQSLTTGYNRVLKHLDSVNLSDHACSELISRS